MTKEQEETINRLEKLINIRKNKAGQIKYDNCICSTTAIETILNMLKEKDIQINSKNGTINALQCALKERTEERDRKDDIVTKQNKTIDLMAEHICNSAIIDDTVCAIRCDCETDILEDCTHEKMLRCTKQYFKSKIEKE